MNHPISDLILSKLSPSGFTDEALTEIEAAFRRASADEVAAAAALTTIGFLDLQFSKAGAQLRAIVLRLLIDHPSASDEGLLERQRNAAFAQFEGREATRPRLDAPKPEGSKRPQDFGARLRNLRP
jgi:hypothetical protein